MANARWLDEVSTLVDTEGQTVDGLTEGQGAKSRRLKQGNCGRTNSKLMTTFTDRK